MIDFYANFGVPYLSIIFISMNIPSAEVLLLQEKYTAEIVTCLNQNVDVAAHWISKIIYA